MNQKKLEEYSRLLKDSEAVLQGDVELWKQFLRFAAQFTHYRFRDQLLIYAQNQQASACATFDQWKKIGRYVKSGEHSIVLIDDTGSRLRLRHVFDVSSTGSEQEFAYKPIPILPEEREELARRLSAAYAQENTDYALDISQKNTNLEHTLSQITLYMTQEYYDISPDQAAEQSEDKELPSYYIATATSAMYLLLSKYGFDKEANQLDFSCMTKLDGEAFESAGIAASAILSRTAKLIRQIHPQVQREAQTQKERSNNYGRDENDNGRYPQENHVPSGGRISSTGDWISEERGERNRAEEIRNDEEKISGESLSSAIREDGDERDIISEDEEDRRDRRSDERTDVAEDGERDGSNRGIEENESTGVGSQDGSLQSSGGRDHSEGTGVQLTLADYLELRPTERDDFDSDVLVQNNQDEQEESSVEIEPEAETIETEKAVGEEPAAFSVSEEDITRILQEGSGFENGKIRIEAIYQQETDAEKRADLLRKEYGIGGRTYFFADGIRGWLDYDSHGLHIRKGSTFDKGEVVLHLGWRQVEERIGELIQEDRYFLASEKEAYSSREKEEKADEHIIIEETEHSSQPEVEKTEITVIPGQNFQITDEHLGEGSPKQKFRANMDAIYTLRLLEEENRNATQEEQEVMSKYVGWGGLADAFDERKAAWTDEYHELKTALLADEYAAARESTLNAHYTSPTIIHAIYEALGRFGFKNGSILEPSMGVGNFFGLLPDSMQDSRLYGVELDSLSGRIAKKLYPKAQITVAGFETTSQRNFYDLAIGNVPFGNYKVNDRAYNRLGFSIHNYFFAKALDQVRPGGIVAFVTSHYTLDSKNSVARRHIAQRAQLLGAIRLPDNAFRANAGAEVVSDIIFLQKREHIVDIEEDWIHLGQAENGYAINSYFVDHPEMVLGTLEEQSTQYGVECTVKAYKDRDLSDLLSEAITHVYGHYEPVIQQKDEKEQNKADEILPADPTVRNYTYALVDGTIYYRENSIMRKVDRAAAAKERTRGLLEIREALNAVIQRQLDDAPDEEIQSLQRQLETTYDAFSKKFGLINDKQNARMLDGDSSYFLLCSLENLDENGELLSKADIFSKRTIRAQKAITSADTPADALAISIGEKGHVDLTYMAELLGKSGQEDEVAKALKGVIFRDPQEENEQNAWKTADEYLSGDVRSKLRLAMLAVSRNPEYEANVQALQAAQPKDLTASEIDVRLGATWIDQEYIQEFMHDTFHTPYYLRERITVTFVSTTGEWRVNAKNAISYNDVNAYTQYGTSRMNAYAILEQTLNLRSVTVYDRVTDADGTTRSIVNPKETMLAQQKQSSIKEAFAGWIWKDPQRRMALEQKYNERFNCLRPAEFSGDHIQFVGMNPLIGLRTHQKNAIAHILYGGNTLLAHEVGAGKTYTMAAAAMESKRLGLCQKSLFVVPNHLILQWANEFQYLYPAANLLVATKKDFETANRKKFCARIATGDYDAIIIGHSQFERIPVSAERQERLLQKQMDEIETAIQESAMAQGQSFTIKQLEKTKKSLTLRLEKLRTQERKDDVVTFEELGVDRLFVDEAHAYKNLFLYTKMRNVAGLSASEAQKSSDMFMKCQYMDELTGGKGIVFATGTPVSNSMVELYTMMRYLQYGELQKRGLTQFDAWASVFGETVTASELAPEGTGYRTKTRFAKFFNLPELMNFFKQAADIQTADQLKLPVPEAQTHTVVVQPSELQKEMVANLSERAALVHNGSVDPSQDNMLKITSDGRKIGLDQRLMNSLLPDDPNSKVNTCVQNILQIWKDGEANYLTQLVFCDNSTPKSDGTFNVYDDVKNKLIEAGIPEEEVAFIHDADTEIKKKELFSKVRGGQVRVLIGSTQKMGAGTNVQTKLIAVHHLDVGWRPADMIQRNGRIIRQGNTNPVVQIYNYVTEGTFDAYLWQTLENKQKFISQIMTSKSPVRSCEDVDEQVLSYAEVKALCAGDDRIKEKMDLEVEVARLKMLKAEHQSAQYRLEDRLLKVFPEQIKKKQELIQALEEDMETAIQHPAFTEDTISLKIFGTTYTDRKEAAKALLEAGRTCKDTRSVHIGSYRGFELEGYINVVTAEIQISMNGKLAHPFDLSSVPALNLTRLDSVLQRLPKQIELEKGKCDALIQQEADAKKQLGAVFPQEEELKEKMARLEELTQELDMDSKSETENLDVKLEEKQNTRSKVKETLEWQSKFLRFCMKQKEKNMQCEEELEF